MEPELRAHGESRARGRTFRLRDPLGEAGSIFAGLCEWRDPADASLDVAPGHPIRSGQCLPATTGGTAATSQRYGRMAIIRSVAPIARPGPAPAEIAAALADLCRREGLDDAETTAVLCVALS